MECRELEGFIDPYLDGEFDGVECREVEVHLDSCQPCQRLATTQARFKAVVHEHGCAVQAPDDLHESVQASLLLTDLQSKATDDDLVLFGEAATRPRRGVPRWRSTAPVFISTAVVLGFVAFSSGGFLTHDEWPVLIDDAVDKHLRSLPMEFSGGNLAELQGWVRGKVDFHPRLPAFGQLLRPEGVRLSHIVDRPAVYLRYYDESGEQASLFAFVDPALALDALPDGRALREDVVLTTRRGVNVVMWRDDEIVYSLVSDLDERELLQLIDSIR